MRTRTPLPGRSPGSSGCGEGSSIGPSRCSRRAWTRAARRTSTSGGRFPRRCSGWRASCSAGMDEGLRLLEDGVSLTEALGVRAYLALWTTHLGEGLLAADQVERARTVAQRALDLARAHKERGHQAWALSPAGRHRRAQAAGRHRTPSMTCTRKPSPWRRSSRCGRSWRGWSLSLGQLHARAGDRDKAQDHLGTALGLLREMDIRYWSARAAEELMELGHLFIVARDNVAALRLPEAGVRRGARDRDRRPAPGRRTAGRPRWYPTGGRAAASRGHGRGAQDPRLCRRSRIQTVIPACQGLLASRAFTS